MTSPKFQILAITGSGSGFGAAIAREGSRQGYQILSLGRSHSPTADVRLDVDLSSKQAVIRVAEKLKNYNISTLILNAFKFGNVARAEQIGIEEIGETLQINLLAQKLLVDAVLQTGTLTEVIAISSGAASRGYAGWLHYCIGKAALDSMLRVYSEEKKGIKFWSASPGVLSGSLNKHLLAVAGNYEWKDKLSSSASSPEAKARKIITLLGDDVVSSGDWVKL